MRNRLNRFIKTHLSRYLDGQLGPDESAMVEKELNAHPELQKTLDSLQRTSERLQEAHDEMNNHEETIQRLGLFVKSLPQKVRSKKAKEHKPVWGKFFAMPDSYRLAGLAFVLMVLAVIYVPNVITPQVRARATSVSSVQDQSQDMARNEVRHEATGKRRGENVAGDIVSHFDESSADLYFGQGGLGQMGRGIGGMGMYGMGMGMGMGMAGMGMGGGNKGQDVLFTATDVGDKNGDGYFGFDINRQVGEYACKRLAVDFSDFVAGKEEGDGERIDEDGDSVSGKEVHSVADGRKIIRTVQMADSVSGKEVHSVADGRKIIRTVQMAVEVEELPSAQNAVDKIVGDVGGLVAVFQSREKEKNPSAYYMLWIPAEALDGCIKSLESLGETENLDIRINDISETYFDTETRIKNLQNQEERLQSLYDRDVKKLDELLSVEQKMGQIRLEIEQLQGRRRIYDRQIQYSTIELRLRQKPEEVRIVESEPDDVFSPIRRTLKDSLAILLYSCSLVTTIVARVISLVLFLLPWAIITVTAIWLWRRYGRRNR